MRATLLPRGRSVSRLCEICKHKRNISTKPFASTGVSTRLPQASSAPIGRYPQAQQPRYFSTTQHTLRPTPASAAAAAAEASSSTLNSTTPSPPPQQTHYDFFPRTLPKGAPPQGDFAIDVRTLRREFLQLQAKAHPDLHPSNLKSRAEATSARINEAYKTLSSPLLRAQYLLDLRLGEFNHPSGDEAAKVEDPELLMQVLEAREIIEEAEDESELAGIKAENDERIRESEENLSQFFAEDDIEAAKHEAVKLRYWMNIQDTLHNWEKGKPVVLEH